MKNNQQKQMIMKKNSKRHQENKKTVFDTKPSTLSDAIKKLKDINKTKFDETLDVAVVLNKEKRLEPYVI